MLPESWIEHRREDGELLGWIVPRGEHFDVIDLMGRPSARGVGWIEAERVLEDAGLSFLAEPFELQLGNGDWVRVRLVDVSPARIRAKTEDWGDINATVELHELPFPAPETLRPLRGGAPGQERLP